MQVTLVDYFDVWGNGEEGFTVNKVHRSTVDVSRSVLRSNLTLKRFVRDYLNLNCEPTDIEIDGDDLIIEFTYMPDNVDDPDYGFPLCRIESESPLPR